MIDYPNGFPKTLIKGSRFWMVPPHVARHRRVNPGILNRPVSGDEVAVNERTGLLDFGTGRCWALRRRQH
jgi:hypothetical protein